MKKVLFAFCAALAMMTGVYLGWLKNHTQANRTPVKVATHMEVQKLANGTLVFQEVPDNGSIAEIAPAAGDEPSNSRAPRYKYDPLTQTYRATKEDGSQSIIRDPLHPSKN